MRLSKQFFIAVALLAAFTASASAGVIVDLNYTGKGQHGLSMKGVKAYYNGGSYGGNGGWAGQLNINISPTNPFDFAGAQTVFCTELNEYASGSVRDYYMDTLNNLDIPSTAPAMGTNQKIALERLFSLVGEVDDDTKGAGFQVAVWEISQDVDFGNLQNPAAGNFYLELTDNNYLSKFNAILDSANYFLNELATQNQVSVLGMVNDGSQDFLHATPPAYGGGISSVPEPATFAIFGLIGLVGCGRRRLRK